MRDPRFESLTAGPVVEEQYKKRYAFLYDDHLPQEKKELAAGLKKVSPAGRDGRAGGPGPFCGCGPLGFSA